MSRLSSKWKKITHVKLSEISVFYGFIFKWEELIEALLQQRQAKKEARDKHLDISLFSAGALRLLKEKQNVSSITVSRSSFVFFGKLLSSR